jgi:spectinomycin phosphotransferase
MREKPSIPEELLHACLQEQYDLSAVRLDFLPLGLDTKAEVYRVLSDHRTPYFLKAKSGPLYEPSCLVPGYLRDQGIASVVAPLPTNRNTLWSQVGDWTVIMYPFIDGETGSHLGMTDENWKEVGTIVKQIHRVILPPSGFGSLRKETFQPTEYVRWVRAFETQQTGSLAGSRVEHALRSCWMEHQPAIHTVLTSLEELAGVLQGRSGPYVICHADLHPGNILRDPDDHLFVVDWDDVLLASKERDFLFVREAPAEGSTRQEPPPFFQGYGQTEIDWVALTYYRCERVIQDLIEGAGQVWFQDDLSEASKAAAIQLFNDIFAEGGELDAAFAAAAHLQSDLSFYNKEGV